MSIHKGESSWQLNNNNSSVHCLLKGKHNFPSYPYLNCAYETRNILSAFIFSCTKHNLIKVKESKSITWCGEVSFTALLSSQFCSCLDRLFLRSFFTWAVCLKKKKKKSISSIFFGIGLFFLKTTFGCDPIHPVSQTIWWARDHVD